MTLSNWGKMKIIILKKNYYLVINCEKYAYDWYLYLKKHALSSGNVCFSLKSKLKNISNFYFSNPYTIKVMGSTFLMG